MRVLYFDCFSGIAGDMTVGALADLGVAPEVFIDGLEKLGLEGFHVHFHRETRQHLAGTKFEVHLAGHSHESPHPKGHTHGRSHREIQALIETADLSAGVKKRARSVFQRLAVAEGKVHDCAPEDVTFHEVGAVDSIVDIVAACLGFEALGIEKVFVSALTEGSGWVDSAHGRFPVPAPATLELLAGFPLKIGDGALEMITPTGAAILAEFAIPAPLPVGFAVERVGYGVGTREMPDRPNVLRAVLGTVQFDPDRETVTLIETNLDDLSPEIAGATLARVLEAGALDAWFVPVQMKKGRPGFILSVLSRPGDLDRLCAIILRETSAFGVRHREVERQILQREFVEVETAFGPVTMKIGRSGDEILQASPEFEACQKIARKTGAPVREVMAEAHSAWRRTRPA